MALLHLVITAAIFFAGVLAGAGSKKYDNYIVPHFMFFIFFAGACICFGVLIGGAG